MTDSEDSDLGGKHDGQGPIIIGLRLKQVVLAFGAVYLGMVALTNLVNFVSQVSGSSWAFLNSQNADYIATIVKVYAWPGWFDELAVLSAAGIEAVGAILFIRALLHYRRGRLDQSAAYLALTWNIGVWFAFIVGTEFFVAYPSESPFRELLALGLLMTVIIAVVPDGVPVPPVDAAG